MSDMETPSSPPGLLARAIGVIVSPVDTFRSVVRAPRPVGILFLVCLVTGLATGLPQFTESGRRAMLDVQITQIERTTGQTVDPEQYARLERFAAFGPYMTLVGTFINIPVFTVIFSALYRPARSGRKVAYLTVASFAFLAASLAVRLFVPSEHGGGIRVERATATIDLEVRA